LGARGEEVNLGGEVAGRWRRQRLYRTQRAAPRLIVGNSSASASDSWSRQPSPIPHLALAHVFLLPDLRQPPAA
jgi:hypothetical protein